MKRDLDLIRKILLSVEMEDNLESLSGYPERQLIHHVAMVIEAGYVHGKVKRDISYEIRMAFTFGLTWKGHEFLDAARNESVWNTVKNRVLATTGGMTVAIVQELLGTELKKRFGMG